MLFELLKITYSNHAFSVQHACGLSTTPTPLACAGVTAHARAQHRKELSTADCVLCMYNVIRPDQLNKLLHGFARSNFWANRRIKLGGAYVQ